ncbi:Hypothetical protein DHA2_114912 [Giardia duodenalis]|uniref:Calponin-homology (CH) domain-containing protein n=1 Tax=Giardia intestinalis TaxID=5741 RepID=V6TK37_GIAIN|nr:Hypothetical protein DHA2_114912 [Giardia intestinalis]
MSKVYSERREPWQDDPLLFFPNVDDFKPQALKAIRQICDTKQLATFSLGSTITLADLGESKVHPSSNLRGASAKRRAPEEGLIQLSLAKAKQAISHIKNTTDTRLPSRSLADTEIIDLIWLEIMGGDDARHHLRAGTNRVLSDANKQTGHFSFYELVTKEEIAPALSSGVPFALALKHFDHITTTKSELYLEVINHNPRNSTERYVNWEKCMRVFGLLPTFNIDLLFKGRELASGSDFQLLFDVLHEFHRAATGTGLVLTHTCLELALLDELCKASMSTPLSIKQLNNLYANSRSMACANLPQKAILVSTRNVTPTAQSTPSQPNTRSQSFCNPVCRGSVTMDDVKSMLTPSTPSKKDYHKDNLALINDLSKRNREQKEMDRESLLRRVSNTAYSSILSAPGTPRSDRSLSARTPSTKRPTSTPNRSKTLSETAIRTVLKRLQPDDLPPTVRSKLSSDALRRLERSGVITYENLLEAFNANKHQLHSFLTAFTDATSFSIDSLARDSIGSADTSFTVGCLGQTLAFGTTASASTSRGVVTQADLVLFSKQYRKILFDVLSFDSSGLGFSSQDIEAKMKAHASFLESAAKDKESRLLNEQVKQLQSILQLSASVASTYNITRQNLLLKATFIIENWLRGSGCIPPSEVSVESPIYDPYRNGIAVIQIFNLVYHKSDFFREMRMRLSLTDDLYACYSTVGRVTRQTEKSSDAVRPRSNSLRASISSESARGIGTQDIATGDYGLQLAQTKDQGLLFPRHQAPINISDCIHNNNTLLRKLAATESVPSGLLPTADALVQGDFSSLQFLLLLLYLFDALRQIFESRREVAKRSTNGLSIDDLCLQEFSALLSEIVDLYGPKTDQLLQAQRGPKPIPRTKDELSRINGICYSVLLCPNRARKLFSSLSGVQPIQVPQALAPSKRASSIISLQKSMSMATTSNASQSTNLANVGEDEKEIISYFSALEAAHMTDYTKQAEQYKKLENALSNWLYSLDCLPEPYMKIVDIAYFLRDGVGLCKIVSEIFKLTLTPIDPCPKSANIQLGNIKRALKFARDSYQYRSVPIPFIDAFEETAVSIQRAEVGAVLILMRELYRVFSILRRETSIGGRAMASIGVSSTGVAYKLKASRRSPSLSASLSASPGSFQRSLCTREAESSSSKILQLVYAIDNIETYADSTPLKSDKSVYISDCLVRAPEEMHAWKLPSVAYPLVSMQPTMVCLPYSVKGEDFVSLPQNLTENVEPDEEVPIVVTAALDK